MSMSILNNIPSLAAQNQLSQTGASLNTALQRLASGSRINSGADDAAGLAIADGLHANSTALTQSTQNATDGVGQLQVADGALAQVTTLLDRAVTLATEAATSTASAGQRDSMNAEYTQIKAEITRIGTTTSFNGANVFAPVAGATNANSWTSTTTAASATAGKALAIATTDTFSIADASTGKTFTMASGADATVGALVTAINAATAAGTINVTASVNSTGQLQIKDNDGTGRIAVNSSIASTGAITDTISGGSQDVFVSDGGVSSHIQTTIGELSTAATSLNLTSTAGLSGTDGTNAQNELGLLNTAVALVAAQRGAIGAGINTLQAASQVMNDQVQNLTQAEDSKRAANVGQEVANMTKYNILNSTGIAALQQSNQAQQSILKLLQ